MQSVEQLWAAVKKYGGLTSADQGVVHKKWFGSNRPEVNDLGKFTRWLTINHHLSDFALQMIQAGKGDLLRLGDYQIIDQIQKGPQTGSYLALDQVRSRVAIDLLNESVVKQPVQFKAFQEKAAQALELDQQNINHVLDTGEANGFHFLVREADQGELLGDILKQRSQLAPVPATKLFAMALASLQTLHDHQLNGGPLGVDSLLLAQASRTGQGTKLKTLKLLNWGFPRELFDPTLLQRRAGLEQASVPPTAALAPDWNAVDPAEDLHRLGSTLYRSLTGGQPRQPAKPIQEIQSDVPEMLAEVVDQMVASNPADRPRNAALAAKRLRVFLASEEEAREVRPEEQLASPTQASTGDPTGSLRKNRSQASDETAKQGKLIQLWEEIRPCQRDWFFFGAGVSSLILLTLLLRLILGIQFVNLVCLLAGGAVSFLVERWIRLREQSSEEMVEMEPSEG